ncbi:galactose-1-phosphate uridylyltransferase [Streptomyces sp. HNM0663]|uniref:Galactose-1-phosphate uridylyltransferase n=1 Tax=Streptomyces chengmaiensis TaxID=3040919 RepID=A0ABT6HX68_9ACTN|nr:galactose-1-phosphate uridylyltransferase [Streptomyces chengmaiensis]MDH2393297.1 galactose-1-phosphate uridylyltransferase [Streptomyces chengmaiensis]
MNKTSVKLADGRELIYFDPEGAPPRTGAGDLRPLEPGASRSEIRLDPVTGDWVTIAGHRQARTYQPPADECPLCPSREGRLSEIPDEDYHVVVFENRFPSLAADAAVSGVGPGHPAAKAVPGTGRCEVVCFTAEHATSFAGLSEPRARLVLDTWTDRTAELSALPDVQQVYVFENRGAEIGVTLAHPHGQIYAFPFIPPRTSRVIEQAGRYRAATGRNLFEDLLTAERADPVRVVLAGEHWTAFVPFAARWPHEVHVYPHRRVPNLTALTEVERAEFPRLYLELLKRFDRLFVEGDQHGKAQPTPYIAAWHQAPAGHGQEMALHLELFTIRRTAGKLKFLAGVESGVGAFVNDVVPEAAARRLREVAS